MEALGTILPLVLIIAVFYLLILRPQRARQRQQQQMVNSAQPGQRVMTTAGLYGTLTDVTDEDFGMEIAPGVVVRHIKGALAKVITEPEATDTETSSSSDATDSAA